MKNFVTGFMLLCGGGLYGGLLCLFFDYTKLLQ